MGFALAVTYHSCHLWTWAGSAQAHAPLHSPPMTLRSSLAYLPGYLFGEVAIGQELQLAPVLGLMVHNLNVPGLVRKVSGQHPTSRPHAPSPRVPPDLINPELAHNDVMHSRGALPPHVVIPTGLEF